VKDSQLSRDDKRQILCTREEDTKALLRAENENMSAAKDAPNTTAKLALISKMRKNLDVV
jgi:hypothetical protein